MSDLRIVPKDECTRKRHVVKIKIYHTEMVEKVVSVSDVELSGSVDAIYKEYSKLDPMAGHFICTQACCAKSVAATGLVPEEIVNV